MFSMGRSSGVSISTAIGVSQIGNVSAIRFLDRNFLYALRWNQSFHLSLTVQKLSHFFHLAGNSRGI